MVTRTASCKVNFLLNVLGKRDDGFHELETLLHPVPLRDIIEFQREGTTIQLSCEGWDLESGDNLAYRAAKLFLEAASIREGVKIRLEKRIPLAAGLGGGSSDAAATLLGLNELFALPLTSKRIVELAASLGSDVPFFLQDNPAIAEGRGERVKSVRPFSVLQGYYILLVHPRFGVPTPWAYDRLSQFPEALNGRPGRAETLVEQLNGGKVDSTGFYNSLESPVLEKYPLLRLFREHFFEAGAEVALMSGSGSSTFALVKGKDSCERLHESFIEQFGENFWTTRLPIRDLAV